jgi:K+-sensing histidine kinase KdpD
VDQLPSSNESISAHSLVDLIEFGDWMDFLQTVYTYGVALGWEMRIQYGGSARGLQLHASQTPCGILVFAILLSGSPALKQDRSAVSAPAAESLTSSDLISRQSDAVNKRDALEKHEEESAEPLLTAVHDLKNPISSIISACEYLTEYSHENLDPVQLDMIRGIESSARSLIQLSGTISRHCRRRS